MGETWGLEMELVRGVTLDALIAEQGRLSVPAVVLIISELLEGLQYAHAAKDEEGLPLGLVHRDLKPENIVVTHEGRLKLLDFVMTRRLARPRAPPST
jgi:serine/threonine-protein kinase